MKTIKVLAVMTLVFLVIDTLWIQFFVLKAYKSHISDILIFSTSNQVRIVPAVLVYILLIGATYFFAVRNKTSFKENLYYGAAFGFASYGVYSLTNAAILIRWPAYIVITDCLWGMVLCAVVAVIGGVVLRSQSKATS